MKLIIDNLHLERGDKFLFKNMSFSLESYKPIIVRGSNGSGKTSLLRSVAGLLKPVSGKISFFNETGEKTDYLHECNYSGHKLAIKNELTVQENITFWGRYYKKEINKDLLIKFKLDSLSDISVGLLSYGQMKKLSLIRVFLAERLIWLLDEPMVGLDSESQIVVKKIIEKHINLGKLIIITTHTDLKFDNQILLSL
jgi:heme exporter protein A